MCWTIDLVTSSSGASSKFGVWMINTIYVICKIIQDIKLGIKCSTMIEILIKVIGYFKIKQNGYPNHYVYQNYYQTPKAWLNLMPSTGFSTFLVHTQNTHTSCRSTESSLLLWKHWASTISVFSSCCLQIPVSSDQAELLCYSCCCIFHVRHCKFPKPELA